MAKLVELSARGYGFSPWCTSKLKMSLSCTYARKINDRVTERKLPTGEIALYVAIAHEQFSASNCPFCASNWGICSGIKPLSTDLS